MIERLFETLTPALQQELLLQTDMGLFDQLEQTFYGSEVLFVWVFRLLVKNQIRLKKDLLLWVSNLCEPKKTVDILLARLDQDPHADGVVGQILPETLNSHLMFDMGVGEEVMEKIWNWFKKNPDRIPLFTPLIQTLLRQEPSHEAIRSLMESCPEMKKILTQESVRQYGVPLAYLEADYVRGNEEAQKEARRILIEKFPSASPSEKERIFWILSKVSDPDTDLHALALSHMEVRHAGELFLATMSEGDRFVLERTLLQDD